MLNIKIKKQKANNSHINAVIKEIHKHIFTNEININYISICLINFIL